jgi:hypothetical protein
LEFLGAVQEFRLRHIRKLLDEVLELLAEHGIEVMLLKGAAFLVSDTTRSVMRSMNDIDLLVVKGSAENALQVCRGAGWGLLYQDATQYEGHHHLPPLIDAGGVGLKLELHRSLIPGGATALGIDEAGIAKRARQVMVGSTSVRVPTLEDLLIHACLHFAWGHALQGHSWSTFSDAHTIVADPGFTWERFLELVRQTRGGTCCYWTLRLAKSWTGLPVPQEVLDQLSGPRRNAIEVILERHFFALLYDPAAATIPIRLRHFFWEVGMRPRWSGLGKARPWKLQSPTVRRPADPTGGQSPRSLAVLRYLRQLVRPPQRRPPPSP